MLNFFGITQLVQMIELSFIAGDFSSSWIALNMGWGARQYINADWKIVWLIGCYFSWFWRNCELHDDEFIRPHIPTIPMRTHICYYKHAMNHNVNSIQKTHISGLGQVVPTTNGFGKLKC